MSHIVPMITDRMVERLTTAMQTIVPVSDPGRANLVKSGRFQDNPTKYQLYLAVNGGDPEDPNYRDGIVSLGDFEDIALNFDPREVGSGSSWWRRGVVQIGYYPRNMEEDEARISAYDTLGKVCAVLDDITVSDLSDDYGERAYMLSAFANSYFEGGGPAKSYVWRGKVYWRCLTERST